MNIGIIIYFIGMILSFIYGSYQAYIEKKNGKNIDDYPGAICVITFLGWIYFIILIYSHFVQQNKDV